MIAGLKVKTRLALRSRFADPVVLVHTRPSERECGSVGLEALLAGELRARPSSWRSMRQVCFSSKGFPLLPQPGLRSAGRKLTELHRRAEESVRGQSNRSLRTSLKPDKLSHSQLLTVGAWLQPSSAGFIHLLSRRGGTSRSTQVAYFQSLNTLHNLLLTKLYSS